LLLLDDLFPNLVGFLWLGSRLHLDLWSGFLLARLCDKIHKVPQAGSLSYDPCLMDFDHGNDLAGHLVRLGGRSALGRPGDPAEDIRTAAPNGRQADAL
jgi:hypothetical protein